MGTPRDNVGTLRDRDIEGGGHNMGTLRDNVVTLRGTQCGDTGGQYGDTEGGGHNMGTLRDDMGTQREGDTMCRH